MKQIFEKEMTLVEMVDFCVSQCNSLDKDLFFPNSGTLLDSLDGPPSNFDLAGGAIAMSLSTGLPKDTVVCLGKPPPSVERFGPYVIRNIRDIDYCEAIAALHSSDFNLLNNALDLCLEPYQIQALCIEYPVALSWHGWGPFQAAIPRIKARAQRVERML